MPNSTIATPMSRRLTIALIPGIVTLVLAATMFVVLLNLRESRRLVEHTHDVRDTSNYLLTRMIDAETGVRAYLLTERDEVLAPYMGAQDDIKQAFQQLRVLTRDNASQQERLPTLARLIGERFTILQNAVDRRRQMVGAYRPTAGPLIGKIKMDSLRAVVAAVDHEEDQLLARRERHDRWNLWLALVIIGVGGVFAVLVSFVANGMLSSNILRLGRANVELQVQAQRLEEQATELETQASELEAMAVELEASNAELEEQTTVLEEQRDLAHASRVEAEQANAAKSRFLSVMSHELRTPLNAVAGYVDIIDAEVHGPVTDAQREDIRRINRAVAQLTSVINDILNFAKLEAGEVRFSMGLVVMSDVLANASALMEPQASVKGIRFRTMPCDPSIAAWADRERVLQVVLNLLNNAVKYTPASGEVQLACERDGKFAYVRVTDTGRGIAPRDVQRIFDPFVQLLGGPHAPSEGVGLGLAISRDLARGMGGDIVVSSTLGKGSVFELRLPVSAPVVGG